MILALQHVECEPMGWFEDHLREWGIPFEYRYLYAGDPVPRSLKGFTGLIVMGGPMNVYEEEVYPFLRDETDLLRAALAEDLPVLGVCLGSQLIAKAAGARVRRAPWKEIGWCPLALTPEGRRDPLLRGLGPEFPVFQWHGDTFDLPPGGLLLARSPVGHQAFRLGNRIYALQFHLEVTASLIETWLETYADELAALKGEVDPQAVLARVPTELPALHDRCRRFFDGFLGAVLGAPREALDSKGRSP